MFEQRSDVGSHDGGPASRTSSEGTTICSYPHREDYPVAVSPRNLAVFGSRYVAVGSRREVPLPADYTRRRRFSYRPIYCAAPIPPLR